MTAKGFSQYRASQTTTVESWAAVATWMPSSAQAQAKASSVWEFNVSNAWPVSAFVMSVSWKSPTTTRMRPFGLVAEQLTAAGYWNE
jgi:hypothetical protein